MTSKFSIDNRELLQRISSGEAVVGIDFGNLIVRELAAFRLATMDSEPAIADCDPEVYEKGVSVCLVAIPKETAEIICQNITAATGCKVDWHYFGGRVHIKALRVTSQPAPGVPDDVLDALQKVARIRLDLNEFDGDRRGIADCLGDAEEALIEVVNRRAAMLAAAPQSPGSEPATVPGTWIPVSERLPEAGGDMIVFTDGIVMSGVSYAKKKGFYIQALEYDDDEPVDNVTHWMPLPDAPQEVK
ncbi:DUF551 domain-containing protein [Klebsiella pneumoniae subsp. pneumoniae]|nr:DUF551 domain-containing protein [Klebsiella pneumoniae subsp. pneumoniae]